MADSNPGNTDVHARMQHMYRWQRHLYDPTRRFYLVGRDRVISMLNAGPDDRLLEVGCGTGRNLVSIGQRWPGVRLCGLEPARAMLETADAVLARHGLAERAQLVYSSAEKLDPEAQFGHRGFEHVLFSYCLSMINAPVPALDRAFAALVPGGKLWIVDFGPMYGLPSLFRRVLKTWLAWFGVRWRPAVLAWVEARVAAGEVSAGVERIGGGYALLIGLHALRSDCCIDSTLPREGTPAGLDMASDHSGKGK